MGQLRSFSAYTKNANAGVNLVANACTLVNIDGNYIAGAAGQYFQIFDKATAPVNADVPLRSFYLPSAGPVNLPSIYQVIGPLNLTLGLGVAISSTEATLTLGVGTFDVFGDTEEWETQISGLTTAGDLTTGVNNLQVWTNANGPQYLYTIEAIMNLGVTTWLMVLATDIVDGATDPVWTSGPLASSATVVRKFNFGLGGFWPRRRNSLLALKQACSVYVSTTGNILTSDASNNSKIRAKYKLSGQTP